MKPFMVFPSLGKGLGKLSAVSWGGFPGGAMVKTLLTQDMWNLFIMKEEFDKKVKVILL